MQVEISPFFESMNLIVRQAWSSPLSLLVKVLVPELAEPSICAGPPICMGHYGVQHRPCLQNYVLAMSPVQTYSYSRD